MPFPFDRTRWTLSTWLLLLMMVLVEQRTVGVAEEQQPVTEAVPFDDDPQPIREGRQRAETERPQPDEEQQRLITLIQPGGGYDLDESSETWDLQAVYYGNVPMTDELLDLILKQQSLQTIFFYSTDLTDVRMQQLGALKNLQDLRLFSTQVTDEGLRNLASVVSLTRLRIGSTNATGKGLVALTHLPLERLHISSTPIDDEGLAAIGRLSTLKSLSLSSADITDKGIAHLTRLSRLETIHLKETIVTDKSLEHLSHLPNLTSINVRGTLVTGSGLIHLRALKELTSIDISRTALRDKLLVPVFSMPQLKTINLERVKATQAGVRELWRVMPQLEIEGVETLHPGDEETAQRLLREKGDLAIAEYDRRLLEESSPRKREVIEAMRLRDERVKSYRFEWKQTTVNHAGIPNADDEATFPRECSLTVDQHRFASAMQGRELAQNIRTSGGAAFHFEGTFVTRQPASVQRVNRQIRFDGEFDQQLLEYPESNIPATGIRQLAGRVSDTPMEVWPLLWTYSTFDRSISNLDWQHIKVADEPETIEGRPCIQLRLIEDQIDGVPFEDDVFVQQTWSLDPSREHSIVRYATAYGEQEPFLEMDIQHRQTYDDGWIPQSWTIRPQTGTVSNVTTVTVANRDLNIETTNDQFVLRFPPGVEVEQSTVRRASDE